MQQLPPMDSTNSMAAKAPTPPMTQAHYTKINGMLRDIADLEKQIQTAQAGKVECSDSDAYCQSLKSQLEALKSAYFPNKP
jgi:hypothetical protein